MEGETNTPGFEFLASDVLKERVRVIDSPTTVLTVTSGMRLAVRELFEMSSQNDRKSLGPYWRI